MTNETFAEFYFPDTFAPETFVYHVPTRNINSLKWPKNAYAVRFFDRIEYFVSDMFSETGGFVILKSEPRQYSKTFYRNATLLSLVDVVETMPTERALIDNMKRNGYNFVVKTAHGQYFPFDEKEAELV